MRWDHDIRKLEGITLARITNNRQQWAQLKKEWISTTRMVEDIFYRNWLKRDFTPVSNSNKKIRKFPYDGPIVEWIKLPNSINKNYYKFAKVGELFINQGDNILIPPEEKNEPPQIAHVAYMFEDEENHEKMCHAHFYCRGTDTIMGDKSDPRELFLVDHCEDMPLSCIIGKAKVYRKEHKSGWRTSGGDERPDLNDTDDGKNYYFSKRYDYNQSRFVDFIDNGSECISCFWQTEENNENTPVYRERFLGRSYIEWKNEQYYVGSGIFIDYEREMVETTNKETKEEPFYTIEYLNGDCVRMSKIDRDTIFPERYRKFEKKHDPVYVACEPYTVGVIEKITKNNDKITVRVREFYRPEDTKGGEYGDPFLVYWTNRIYTIRNFDKWKSVVKGKCYISNTEHIEDTYQWTREGPSRFYFREFYDPNTCKIKPLPTSARTIGLKTRKTSCGYNSETPLLWPELQTKLKSLDIYAGCGGLSDGLERAGLVETKWAIEINSVAAKSFKSNNPAAIILEQDCNSVLSLLLEGKQRDINMPEKGEVDIIVGGPPCQGYSLINRFQKNEGSKENNSQINTYLGFIDYYRPKYFIFENVRNFVSFNSALYLKLTLKCLLAIGYQLSFGVLQAGNYGLPQTRRRFFVVGAAPGLKLPRLPDPTHCFGRFVKNVESIRVDNLKYDIGDSAIGMLGSLPYRTVTVKDAISDLPPVTYETMAAHMPYNSSNQSHYAKQLREYCGRDDALRDHECNPVSALVRKRIQLIPEYGDWTDLPNIAIKLGDGTRTEILDYAYRTKTQEVDSPPRGMCECVGEKTCNKNHKKYLRSRTIIPWSIAHTADRHNHWRNVYGRLDWDGYFSTVTTNPEPSRSQGKALHPDQDRIISVREYARAQGFHDEFIFVGSTSDKYRQIGNAVPPLLATAIGREIIKAIHANKN
ncbi:DNA (cytosine-5)-methyltransferase 1-like [Sitophilus oryzae]|uniref:Cytosine-specific methyltransferase n=1 Tax=Sitophilus oryzae TaxID=7048 RepID=A0A6J2Y1Y9_SITOR|nr:DNA (cytosine-5)-methyltransferase 1-like [Sitophilus oryzae]